jgi:hypothetical protein
MAAKKTKKQNVPVPPDRELDRLTKRFERLSSKVAKNEFKSEMSGSRLANARLRYQVPKLESTRIAKSNRLNKLLSGQSSVNSLRRIMNSPTGGAAGNASRSAGRFGGGPNLRGK